MKYGVVMILIAVVIIVSCKKTNSSNAAVLFYNATWSLPGFTAAWDGSNIITTPIAQGESSGTAFSPYLQLPGGTNLITLKTNNDTLVNKNIYTPAATGTSFLFFDTSASASTAVSIVQLTDNLALPDTAEINFRFINASPDTLAAATDVWLVNGNVDSTKIDSAVAFIGTGGTASGIQAFLPLSYHGEGYTIKIKKSGQDLVFASIPNYFFAVRGIYSIIFSGLSAGTGPSGFKLSVLHHFTQ